MRLRELLCCAWVACAVAQAQPQSPEAASSPALSASAVHAALKAVREDPLLPGTEKSKRLRFKDVRKEGKAEDTDIRWWLDLMGSLSAGLRVGIWIVGAAILIWILLRLRDWLKGYERVTHAAAAPPTHVGSLDIRPQSLPPDIGAAARELLGRGELRAALSLLYRGALSRLVHGHGVPIRGASTENECLALAAQRLAPDSLVFLQHLVASWQMVAYARRQPLAEELERLCAEFDARLGTRLAPRGST